MNFEKFISEQKHPAPEKAPAIEAVSNEKLIGREKVVKLFKKLRPETADVFLLPHGL
ncbi:MAG: hypothetical protein U0487_03410 [Patescibacteria group bacterium]